MTVTRTEEQVKASLKRRRAVEKGAFGALWLTGGVVIVVLFFVIFYLLIQSGKFFIGSENLMEDAVMMETNAEIAEMVANDPNAIGYLSLSALDASVKPIVLNGIMPSVDMVADGWYPIVQDLHMVTHGEVTPVTEAWIAFVMSQEGQTTVAEAGFVPVANSQSYQPASGLSGSLSIAGSSTMQRLAEALTADFSAYHPDVSITLTSEDSTSGIRDAGKDNVDVGMSSREIRDYEFVRYDGMVSYTVAQDGIAIIANPRNPVGGLTINQARDLFTGVAANWQDVGGHDAPVVVVSRELDTGSWDGFEKWVLSKNAMMARGLESGNLGLFFQNLWASMKFIWRFLTTRPLPGMGGKGGISTTIITTVYMVLLTLAIATPLGVGAAIYLVEYAGEMSGKQSGLLNKVVTVIRFAVETLAGVPSILYGLFGFAFFVTAIRLGLSMIAGALAGACLILPVVIRTTEEALLTVPRSYREGSLALGATKWQTNYQVVLPAAMPGIVTGIILGVGRVISETAVFYVTLGGSINMPESVMDQGRTMVLHLYSLMMDANAPDPAMGTAMVVVVVIVMINLAINYFSSRLSQSLAGKA
ncbi:MAG: phosphate ABC transporter permease PstA [Anaerolineae bacterium]|nr:phosphate ABC transporter permease PstA [Anaerolineae bacterium]